jgi:hypothetical protein
MAEQKGKKDTGQPAAAAAGAKPTQLGLRLAPVEGSDQPVFANVCSVNVSPGVAFIDFGFLEPAMLAALPRVVRSGGKLPERIEGKLAVRVALGVEALASLHQQLGRVLSEGRQAARSSQAKES